MSLCSRLEFVDIWDNTLKIVTICHRLQLWWFIVNWTIRSKCHLNLYQNTNLSPHENVSKSFTKWRQWYSCLVVWKKINHRALRISRNITIVPEDNATCRQISNISRTLVGKKLIDHSYVVGASPVGAVPTTSSLSTLTPGFNELGKNNWKTRRETFELWDFVLLILDVYGNLSVCWHVGQTFAETNFYVAHWVVHKYGRQV